MLLRPAAGLRHLDVADDRVDEEHVVAAFGEVRGVSSRAAADIDDTAVFGQEPGKDVPAPKPDQVTEARLPQTPVLVNQLIPGRHPTINLHPADLHPASMGKPPARGDPFCPSCVTR